MKTIRYPEHEDTALGWQLDLTEIELTDTLAPAYLYYRGKRVAILTNGGIVTLDRRFKPEGTEQ